MILSMGRSNKGKHFLDHNRLERQKIQRIFNYQQVLIQKLAPGVAYQQEFLPNLGWASQCCGTKFGHEMSPKYWSNSRPRGGSEKLNISISLPSSQTPIFLNKVAIPCLNTSSPNLLACHAVSRAILDLVKISAKLTSFIIIRYFHFSLILSTHSYWTPTMC